MSASNSSYSLMASTKNEATHRPPEIDRFVDHFLSLMCDRSRRQILELLAIPSDDNNSGHSSPLERRSTDIAKELRLSPTTVSEHLRQLSEAKLVASRREGTVIYYRLYNHLLVRAFQDLILALNHEHATRLQQEVS
ncbi:MAG: hypothetical protein NVSMB33_06440 [Ktedonobacteraceae bacterium]